MDKTDEVVDDADSTDNSNSTGLKGTQYDSRGDNCNNCGKPLGSTVDRCYECGGKQSSGSRITPDLWQASMGVLHLRMKRET